MRLPQCRSQSRPAVVLLAVLIVVVVMTLAAYQYSEWVTAEYKAADAFSRTAQARSLALSGVNFAAAALSNPETYSSTLGNNPFDNSQVFQSVLVQEHEVPRFQGRFSLVSPLDPDTSTSSSQAFRYGVTDECGKININALMKLNPDGSTLRGVLMKLPNMTDDIASAIIDWLDADDEPQPGGAENAHYAGLSHPYRCKNGPLDTIEEMLLINGVTPQLLFGNDRNRNGVLDPDEDDGSGVLDRGWSAYLTVYSRERNLDSSNNPRIYINDQDLNTLSSNLESILGQDLANFIIAYRMYGPSSSGGSGQSGSGGSGNAVTMTATISSADRTTAIQTVTQARGSASSGGGSRPRSISSLFALINTSVSIPSSQQNQPAINLPSPLNDPGTLKQYLPILLDKVTTKQQTELPARVNINTASRAVLAALPNLEDADVQAILDHRPVPGATDTPDPIFNTPAWLITEANLPASTLQSLEQYITGRSQVYRVQSLGYFDGGGPTARIEAVIDTNAGRPRIAYFRDLTETGKGFNLQN